MSKSKSGPKRSLFRSSTGSTVRGRISAPIPFKSEDDDFPIRHPGASVATPLKEEEIDFSPAPPVTTIAEDSYQKEWDEEKMSEHDSQDDLTAIPDSCPDNAVPTPVLEEVQALEELSEESTETKEEETAEEEIVTPPIPQQPPPDIPMIPEDAEIDMHRPDPIFVPETLGTLDGPLEPTPRTPSFAVKTEVTEDCETPPKKDAQAQVYDAPLATPVANRQQPGAASRYGSAQTSPEGPVRKMEVLNPVATFPGARDSSLSDATDKPQRKKSTFSKVFGRIFGRKRKAVSASPTSRQRINRNSEMLINDGPPLRPQRSNSLPINELSRALNSHSPFPEPLAQEEIPELRSSAVSAGRPRGATTPSRLLTGPPVISVFTGLSPRPVSGYGRISHPPVEDDGPIGYAVTSGSHPHRRSRSLGQIRQEKSSSEVRRRSDEIRYWRESYGADPMSPLSSNRPETAPDGNDPGFPIPEQEIEQLPPQPFNFGPLAGMKITQAASLESRVQVVEEKVMSIEKKVAQLHQRWSKRSSLRPGDIATTPRTETFYGYPNLATPKSYYEASSSVPDLPLTNSDDTTRPTSAATAIPMPSRPSSHMPILTLDHYNTLMSLIASERDARRLLEEQVRVLQKDIYTLRSQVPVMTSTRFDYTPSPHSIRGTPPVPPPHRELSSFDQNSSDEDSDFEGSRYGAVTGVDVPASYNNFASFLSNDDEEVFQTPMEENSGAYGAFVGVDSDDFDTHAIKSMKSIPNEANKENEPRRDTSRTMSLSQLTLGRNSN